PLFGVGASDRRRDVNPWRARVWWSGACAQVQGRGALFSATTTKQPYKTELFCRANHGAELRRPDRWYPALVIVHSRTAKPHTPTMAMLIVRTIRVAAPAASSSPSSEEIVAPAPNATSEICWRGKVTASLTIGRADDNDIVLLGDRVSRSHAAIEVRDENR